MNRVNVYIAHVHRIFVHHDAGVFQQLVGGRGEVAVAGNVQVGIKLVALLGRVQVLYRISTNTSGLAYFSTGWLALK